MLLNVIALFVSVVSAAAVGTAATFVSFGGPFLQIDGFTNTDPQFGAPIVNGGPPSTLSITKYFKPGSPMPLPTIVGENFSKLYLAMVKESTRPTVFLEIEIIDATITSLDLATVAGRAMQNLTMAYDPSNFKTIEYPTNLGLKSTPGSKGIYPVWDGTGGILN